LVHSPELRLGEATDPGQEDRPRFATLAFRDLGPVNLQWATVSIASSTFERAGWWTG
jgi:hypothetical protein